MAATGKGPEEYFPLESFLERSVSYQSGNTVEIDFHKEWFGGVAMFGGMVAAAMIRASKLVLKHHFGVGNVPLRSVMMTFARKVKAEEARVVVELIRKGNSVIQLQTRLEQEGEVAATGIYCFASRDTGLVQVPLSRPDVPGPADSRDFMSSGRFSPAFSSHLEYRLATGDFPLSGSKDFDFCGWIRFRYPEPETVLEEHLAIIADAWPPPIMQTMTLDQPRFVASLNWTLEFTPLDGALVHDWWMVYSEAEAHEDGISHAYARLWSPGGKLSTISRQTFAVFKPPSG